MSTPDTGNDPAAILAEAGRLRSVRIAAIGANLRPAKHDLDAAIASITEHQRKVKGEAMAALLRIQDEQAARDRAFALRDQFNPNPAPLLVRRRRKV